MADDRAVVPLGTTNSVSAITISVPRRLGQDDQVTVLNGRDFIEKQTALLFKKERGFKLYLNPGHTDYSAVIII